MKILLDARMYGLEHAGIGRYVLNLVEELKKFDKKNNYVVVLRKNYFGKLNFPKNWEKVLLDIRHYSVAEQIKLPQIIREYNPDIIHSPHYNAPIFTTVPVVTTIHDVLMEKNRGRDATTLPSYLYYSKYLGSKLVFRNALVRSKKIIVPSSAVKVKAFESKWHQQS